jgi:hypothetical protein
MSEWSNQCVVCVPETADRGVGTTCVSNVGGLCLWLFSVARIWSGFAIIAWTAGLEMGVGRFSRPLRWVGVIAMPDGGLDTMQQIEVPPWCWCTTTAYTLGRSWRIYWQSLYSRCGGSYRLIDIGNTRIVQQRSGGGVLTLDCRGYRTATLREIQLTSRYGNAFLTRQQLRITLLSTLVLIHMIYQTSNIVYIGSSVRVRAFRMHRPI